MYYFIVMQKSAYEMLISDLSSDVCSTDLTSMLLRTWRSRSLTPILEQRSMNHLSVSRWRAFEGGLAFPALVLSSCARQARRRLGGREPLRSIAIPAAASA